jgi:hypothetical protein
LSADTLKLHLVKRGSCDLQNEEEEEEEEEDDEGIDLAMKT